MYSSKSSISQLQCYIYLLLINVLVPPVLLGMPRLSVINNAGGTGLYLQTAVQTKGRLISISVMRFIFLININVHLLSLSSLSFSSSCFFCPKRLQRKHQVFVNFPQKFSKPVMTSLTVKSLLSLRQTPCAHPAVMLVSDRKGSEKENVSICVCVCV